MLPLRRTVIWSNQMIPCRVGFAPLSYEFSELTARSRGTLVLFSCGERFAKLNTDWHKAAPSGDPTEPAAVAAHVLARLIGSRETQLTKPVKIL